jgi:heptosyltransferase-1
MRESLVEFPLDPDAEKKTSTLTSNLADYAILNPGAGWGAKQWPPERYGAVARALAKNGVQSLINYGPGEEALATAVESASEGAAHKVSCSVAELISLTRHARLFIGGDTGPLHLAAALQIPVVAIFGPTNPARNGPFGTSAVVLRSESSITSHARLSDPEQGLLEISPEEVIAAAQRQLKNHHD